MTQAAVARATDFTELHERQQGFRASLIDAVDGPEDLDGVVAGSGGALGTGGMASKLSAARLAAEFGGR